mmetsp:Transcript_22565/g.57793  ORF Transcript_22565/g.57793 Transcript_22565/m.57793 type:complete len:274 (-) Transcript_22565:778-1599(-)
MCNLPVQLGLGWGHHRFFHGAPATSTFRMSWSTPLVAIMSGTLMSSACKTLPGASGCSSIQKRMKLPSSTGMAIPSHRVPVRYVPTETCCIATFPRSSADSFRESARIVSNAAFRGAKTVSSASPLPGAASSLMPCDSELKNENLGIPSMSWRRLMVAGDITTSMTWSTPFLAITSALTTVALPPAPCASRMSAEDRSTPIFKSETLVTMSPDAREPDKRNPLAMWYLSKSIIGTGKSDGAFWKAAFLGAKTVTGPLPLRALVRRLRSMAVRK